jgi:hypothetical protein
MPAAAFPSTRRASTKRSPLAVGLLDSLEARFMVGSCFLIAEKIDLGGPAGRPESLGLDARRLVPQLDERIGH